MGFNWSKILTEMNIAWECCHAEVNKRICVYFCWNFGLTACTLNDVHAYHLSCMETVFKF